MEEKNSKERMGNCTLFLMDTLQRTAKDKARDSDCDTPPGHAVASALILSRSSHSAIHLNILGSCMKHYVLAPRRRFQMNWFGVRALALKTKNKKNKTLPQMIVMCSWGKTMSML